MAALLASVVHALRAQGPGVEGVVFLDADGDGRRDGGEAGLAGVAVSNQHAVAITDGEGRYRLADRGTGVVFVSVPDGHRVVGAFWQPAAADVDFALASQADAATFTFLHASDPHADARSLPRLAKVRAIVGARRPAFVLMTGDLVRDAIRVGEDEAAGYYDLYRRETAAWPVPVWSVPGNHENFGIERHLSLVSPAHPLYGKGMYRARLGPNYYSFTRGGIHFVGLDTVDVADLWYYGHVDGRQLAWLRADLAAIPAAMPVVTFNHIPFVSAAEMVKGYTDEGAAPTTLRVGGRTVFRHVVANLGEVLAVLPASRWPLALGGHIHLRELIRYGSPVATRFEQAAAIVGGGSGTVPATSGVTLYSVRNGEVDAGTFIPLD
ncbi:MAG: metallophosphoesterase [Vicinamibacterales bacterium]